MPAALCCAFSRSNDSPDNQLSARPHSLAARDPALGRYAQRQPLPFAILCTCKKHPNRVVVQRAMLGRASRVPSLQSTARRFETKRGMACQFRDRFYRALETLPGLRIRIHRGVTRAGRPRASSSSFCRRIHDENDHAQRLPQRLHRRDEGRGGQLSGGGQLRGEVVQLLHALQYLPEDRQASRAFGLDQGLLRTRRDVLRGTGQGQRWQVHDLREVDLGPPWGMRSGRAERTRKSTSCRCSTPPSRC